jgi:phospholipase/carboxylesterase
MAGTPPPIILQTGNAPRYTIIWLHGLGADGHDFVPIAEELQLPVPVRYIFPHAPMRPVTINGGFVMRAWYDITHAAPTGGLQVNSDARQDAVGIRESQAAIEMLIAQEVAKGISASNIILAGFSQGGVIALHTALRQTVPLGGVLALSTYLPLAESTSGELLEQTKATPIFMAHGRSDPVIPYTLGVASRDLLLRFGYEVEWREYAMQHSVCQEELRDITAWVSLQIKEA